MVSYLCLPMSVTASELLLQPTLMVEAVDVATSFRVLKVVLAMALESFQWLYSVDLETAFPLQCSQGQCGRPGNRFSIAVFTRTVCMGIPQHSAETIRHSFPAPTTVHQ